MSKHIPFSIAWDVSGVRTYRREVVIRPMSCRSWMTPSGIFLGGPADRLVKQITGYLAKEGRPPPDTILVTGFQDFERHERVVAAFRAIGLEPEEASER